MFDNKSEEYRRAFAAYLRMGTPIKLLGKQERITTHYIWRTRDDDKVRASHAANEGRVFAWDSPPPTGHPGTDFGCRCYAEPYDPSTAEYLTIRLEGVSDSVTPWTSRDFVRHYFQGAGRSVTVRETGHLDRIVKRYMEYAEAGILNAIVSAARSNPVGRYSDYFENSYDMTGIVFSIGDTTVRGDFFGTCELDGENVITSGTIIFSLNDAFEDPLDVGIDVIDIEETIFESILRPLEDHGRSRFGLLPSGPKREGIHAGEPYKISDTWTGVFEGRIRANRTASTFK